MAALIADIDNCIARLDYPMSSEMAALLAAFLREGIRIVLITGGEIRNGYIRRIVEPLLDCLCGREAAEAKAALTCLVAG